MGGGGVSKAKVIVGKYEAKLEFLEGCGFHTKYPPVRGGGEYGNSWKQTLWFRKYIVIQI